MSGTLDSSHHQEPLPFVSMLPFVVDKNGDIIFLISDLALHTNNIDENSNSSLMVIKPDVSGDFFNGQRATICGQTLLVESAEDIAESAKLYVDQFPKSKAWVDFGDFNFYRLKVDSIYFIGGFGIIEWVDIPQYRLQIKNN